MSIERQLSVRIQGTKTRIDDCAQAAQPYRGVGLGFHRMTDGQEKGGDEHEMGEQRAVTARHLPDDLQASGPVGPDNVLSGWTLRRVAAGGAALSILVGLLAMTGWALGLPALTQLLSARSAMQPMTALCAILAGSGIIIAHNRRGGHLQGRLLAIIVMVAAFQTLLEFGIDADFGIDRLFFPQSINAQPVRYLHPGRMAAPTATAFLLIGIGLFAAQLRGHLAERLSSATGTAVLLLVTIALLGHVYMVAPLGGVLGFTQVSIPTVLALGGLAVGVLALRPGGGWVRLLVGNSIGATAARWLLPAMVIVPVAVASLALRGSEMGLYPSDFRLAFTTAITIVLLAGLALWSTAQLDRLVAIRRTAQLLQQREATLRAFFETEGLFASILERRGEDVHYLTANQAFAGLFGRADIRGMSVREVESDAAADTTLERLKAIEASGASLKLEQCHDMGDGVRWFATTISPIADSPPEAPRFATASFEITERKHAEAQQRLLLEELNHRVKNTMAVVQSLAQQSFRGNLADPAAKRAFEARLFAVASAHSLLVRQEWRSASVHALVAEVVGPGCGADRGRVDAEGPEVELPPHTAVSVALALHELCTNAVKYGALSNSEGRVAIQWSIVREAPRRLRISWRESGGPPVIAPTTRGFGSKLIERALSAQLGKPVAMEFRPEGLACTIEAGLSPEDESHPAGTS